ncbi:hypothetical protein R6Q57_007401 [Mikania cordata]
MSLTGVIKSEEIKIKDIGSIASTAIVVVSIDHKPEQSDERQRIEDAGGFAMWARTWRVGGVLVVSHAFGDKLFKQFVVADPIIQEIDGSMKLLILASDGLWDMYMYACIILLYGVTNTIRMNLSTQTLACG